MHGYELTDRGKILVTIVLVVLLLLVPSVILLYTAMSSQAAEPDGSPEAYESGIPPPSAAEPSDIGNTNTPPPTGGGFSQPDISPAEGGDGSDGSDGDGNGNGNGDGREVPPAQGAAQPVYDAERGVLSFYFYPEAQETLDDDTASLLRVFLGSAGNAPGSVIAVEIPRSLAGGGEKAILAITGAFAGMGIPEDRLSYATYSDEESEAPQTINLSFIAQTAK